jgi:RNA polymerase sigma-70 factor (ECF subfamily)
MAYAWCHDPALADDLVQKTQVRALEKMGQLRDEQLLNGWLFKILANAFKDDLRARKNTVDIERTDLREKSRYAPERQFESDQIVRQVRSAMKLLSLEHRQVVTMIDLEGLSYKAVAEILEIPVGTVMSRLSRARRNLKNELEKEKAAARGGKHLRIAK